MLSVLKHTGILLVEAFMDVIEKYGMFRAKFLLNVGVDVLYPLGYLKSIHHL